MKKQKTLMFVGAHPDDETFGVGGTLAQYAAGGVYVCYVCATRGEAGMASPEHMQGYTDPGDMRWAELECAAQALGLSDIIYLGYRDSGMPGSDDNKHPQALATANLEQVIGRLVKIIREVKPEVVITFDPVGGYYHPDHIAIHNATVKAFHAAGDPKQYSEASPTFEPQKLYFTIRSRRFLKVAVKLLPLFGQNPHRFGRDKNIDIASMAKEEFPVHAAIPLTKESVKIRGKAESCYRSQIGGGRRGMILLRLANKIAGRCDLYMRAYPPVNGRQHEIDLFAGIL